MLSLRAGIVIAKSWRRFVAGKTLDKSALPPEIIESWGRSKAAGVDARALYKLTGALGEPSAADKRLLAAGEGEVEHLLRVLKREQAMVVLANDSARILAVRATACFRTRLSPEVPQSARLPREAGQGAREAGKEAGGPQLPRLLGARLSEREAGTNCVGLALYLRKPVAVVMHENYAAWTHRWAGYAAPIGAARGRAPAGAVAIIGYGRVPRAEALELARGGARGVERALGERELREHLKVLEEFARQQARTPERALLALSAESRILGFSPAMSHLLGAALPAQALGRRISEVGALAVEGELAATGRTESYRVALHARPRGGAERTLSATATPLATEAGDDMRAGFLLAVSAPARAGARRESARSSWRANYRPEDFVGESRAAKTVLELVRRAADYDWPVFIAGETGSGKELLAGAIHGLSARAQGPFVALDCSTMPQDLVASELFGYVEGSFTGAQRGGKPGKLELADGGTLFLDELADLPLNVQASLLRFLEDSKVIPLGGQQVKTVNVRVIAAINSEPGRAVAQGRLRFDLYQRLSVFKIVVPALRERHEDIALLARHLLDREGFAQTALEADALEALRRHAWPGNVRELRNVLLRAAASCAGRAITAADLAFEADLSRAKEAAPSARRRRAIDKEQLLQALAQCGWNKSHAARLLSVHWVTLHRMMQRLGVTREESRGAGLGLQADGAGPNGQATRSESRLVHGFKDGLHEPVGTEAKSGQTGGRYGPLRWRR